MGHRRHPGQALAIDPKHLGVPLCWMGVETILAALADFRCCDKRAGETAQRLQRIQNPPFRHLGCRPSLVQLLRRLT